MGTKHDDDPMALSATYWRGVAKAKEQTLDTQAVEFKQRESRWLGRIAELEAEVEQSTQRWETLTSTRQAMQDRIAELEAECAAGLACYRGLVRTMEEGTKKDAAELERERRYSQAKAAGERSWQQIAENTASEHDATLAEVERLRLLLTICYGIIHEGLHGGRPTDPEHQASCERSACTRIRAALKAWDDLIDTRPDLVV